jgi:hypothetical protein
MRRAEKWKTGRSPRPTICKIITARLEANLVIPSGAGNPGKIPMPTTEAGILRSAQNDTGKDIRTLCKALMLGGIRPPHTSPNSA